MSESLQIHELDEGVFECKFCKKDFAYLLTDWYYHSKKQLECHKCGVDSEESFDSMDVCADCYFDKSPAIDLFINGCECCKKDYDEKFNDDVRIEHSYCEYCEEYLGTSFIGDTVVDDDLICKACGLDLDKDGKSRLVCFDCRNNLN